MNEKEYIHSLENLLIFMCQTYKEIHDTLLKLAKEEKNEAFFKVSMIQGTPNIIGIDRLAELKFEKPELGFQAVHEKITETR